MLIESNIWRHYKCNKLTVFKYDNIIASYINCGFYFYCVINLNTIPQYIQQSTQNKIKLYIKVKCGRLIEFACHCDKVSSKTK